LDNHLTSQVSEEDQVPQTHPTTQQEHSTLRDSKDKPNVGEQCQQLLVFCYFSVAPFLVNGHLPALAAHGVLQPGWLEKSELMQKDHTLLRDLLLGRGSLIFTML